LRTGSGGLLFNAEALRLRNNFADDASPVSDRRSRFLVLALRFIGEESALFESRLEVASLSGDLPFDEVVCVDTRAHFLFFSEWLSVVRLRFMLELRLTERPRSSPVCFVVCSSGSALIVILDWIIETSDMTVPQRLPASQRLQ
jgi:hypothetical protein